MHAVAHGEERRVGGDIQRNPRRRVVRGVVDLDLETAVGDLGETHDRVGVAAKDFDLPDAAAQQGIRSGEILIVVAGQVFVRIAFRQ